MRLLSNTGRWLLRCAAAFGLLYLAVTFTPLTYWWATKLAGPWDDPTGDTLIVLTGSALDEHIIGMNSYWRAVYAVRFFEAESFRHMIISGGGVDQPALAMRDFVVANGVPSEAIQIETKSQNTHESAVEVAKMARQQPELGRLILVTSDYHMSRAQGAFRHEGVPTEPRPIPDARKRYGNVLERWGVFQELVLESIKTVYYWTQGWLSHP